MLVALDDAPCVKSLRSLPDGEKKGSGVVISVAVVVAVVSKVNVDLGEDLGEGVMELAAEG